ncbi:retrovirus-related Pol polyprotein from transposon 412 [Trichonephila clavipes]|nr:retrovirus-related Pol polyprotein from transposon 412 [Trichonephila clavipes]
MLFRRYNCVLTDIFNDHLRRLHCVFYCIQEIELILNPKKCYFGATEVKVLGHLVSGKGVNPDPDKLEAVNSFPTPKTYTTLGASWDCVHTIDGLSRTTLTKAEKNYVTTEQECLAAIWAITKFLPYLFGKCFSIITDHNSLCWLANLRDPSGQLARLALRLQEYDVSIVFKSGKKHADADCLSRNPIPIIPEIESLAAISDLATEQRDDPSLVASIKACKKSPDLSSARFSIVNNVLCKKFFITSGKQWLPVIPKKCG